MGDMVPSACRDLGRNSFHWFLRYGVHKVFRTHRFTYSLTDGQSRMQYTSGTVFQRWHGHNKSTKSWLIRESSIRGCDLSCRRHSISKERLCHLFCSRYSRHKATARHEMTHLLTPIAMGKVRHTSYTGSKLRWPLLPIVWRFLCR